MMHEVESSPRFDANLKIPGARLAKPFGVGSYAR